MRGPNGRVEMSNPVSRAQRFAPFVIGAVAVIAAAGFWGLEARPSAAGVITGMSAMSVDMDIAGNSATVIGVNNKCIFVHPDAVNGAYVIADVTALGIPGTSRMIGFAYAIGYDASVISVTEENANFLLASLPGSSVFAIPDVLPDADGSFAGNAADLGTIPATSESGSGVLDRLTLHVEGSAAAGKYALPLSLAVHIDTISEPQAAQTLNAGAIAVDRSCYQGDVDCSNVVNSIDALKILRKVASLSVAAPVGCPFLTNLLAGDVDCSTATNSIDALKVLRHNASLPVSQNEPPPCDDIGT